MDGGDAPPRGEGVGPAPGPGGAPLSPAGPERAGRPPGLLDYYLGTKEGRARLVLIIWALSLMVTGLGYALMFWIFMRGRL